MIKTGLRSFAKRAYYTFYPGNRRHSGDITGIEPSQLLLLSVDDPMDGHAIGGKHVHIFLLQKGLSALSTVALLVPEAGWGYKGEYASLQRRSGLFKDPSPLEAHVRSLISSLSAKCYRYLRDFGCPRIVNAHDVVAMVAFKEAWQEFSARAGHRTPPTRILTLHGYFTREAVDYGAIKADDADSKGFALQLERQAAAFCDGIIAVDDRIAEYVRTEFHFERPVQVIPNAVDTESFSPASPEDAMQMKRDLGLALDRPVILVPRRLVKKNGVVQAATGARLLADRGLPFQMVFVGDGPEQVDVEAVAKTVQSPGQIRLEGAVPHSSVRLYFQAADVVLIPSIPSHGVEEATSLAAAEGLACAKPVVAGDVGGLKQMITSGVDGFLCDCREPGNLVEALAPILQGKVSGSIASKARLTAVSRFGFNEHSRTFMRFFLDVEHKRKGAEQ